LGVEERRAESGMVDEVVQVHLWQVSPWFGARVEACRREVAYILALERVKLVAGDGRCISVHAFGVVESGIDRGVVSPGRDLAFEKGLERTVSSRWRGGLRWMRGRTNLAAMIS
jgi:hypothetical protein